jgi:outer membrane protein assembly factor BamB
MRIKKYQLTLFLLCVLAIGIGMYFYQLDMTKSTMLSDKIWSIGFENNNRITTQPVINDGKLFVQTETSLYAYSPFTGDLLWATRLPIGSSSGNYLKNPPLIFNSSYVVVQSQANMISVYNKNDGKSIWHTDYDPSAINILGEDNSSIYDTAISNQLVIASRWNTSLTAYALKDGQEVWSNEVPDRTRLTIMPYKNRIYLGTIDKIIVYDSKDGRILGDFNLKGTIQNYFADENIIFIAFDSGNCAFAAFDIEKLNYQWCIKPSNIYFSRNKTEILLNNDIVYFSGDRLVSIYKMTGSVNWNVPGQDEFENPILYNKFIYLPTVDRLYKVDPSNGKLLVQFKLPKQDSFIFKTATYSFLPTLYNNEVIVFNKNKIVAYLNEE